LSEGEELESHLRGEEGKAGWRARDASRGLEMARGRIRVEEAWREVLERVLRSTATAAERGRAIVKVIRDSGR
jgi:hypothetical protein